MRTCDRPTRVRHRGAAALMALAALAGCGGRGGDAPAAAAPPARAGEVWELDTDSVASRATAPAALQAYVHGLHVMVLDDDEAYAGMTHLTPVAADGGARRYRLAGGGDARLTPQGDAIELRFPDGAAVHLRRRPAAR